MELEFKGIRLWDFLRKKEEKELTLRGKTVIELLRLIEIDIFSFTMKLFKLSMDMNQI